MYTQRDISGLEQCSISVRGRNNCTAAASEAKRHGLRRIIAVMVGPSLAALAITQFSASSAQAATYYWDNDGTAAGFGIAAGTWAAPTTGNATQGWSTSATGVLLPGNITTANTNATTDALNFGNGATGLAAGTITVSGTVSAGAMTFASGSGAIVLSGGTITLPAAGSITVNNTTDTINSVIAGAATSFTKAGTGTLILGGANTYAGSTFINAGTLDLGGGTANGSLASTVLTLGGGKFNYTRTGANTQTFTTTNINATAITPISVTSGNTLNLGTVARARGVWLDLATTGSGTVAAATTSNTAGIMPGFSFGDSWAVANGTSVAISGLANASYALSSTAGTTGTNYSSGNIDVNNNAGSLDAVITPNSLRFSTAAANTLTLTGTGNMVATGGILVGSGVGANLSTITGGDIAGSSGKDLTVIQNNTSAGLTISSVIANNTTATGLTKSGPGLLTLAGNNTYSGITNVNSGTLTFSGNRTATAGLITVGSSETTATLNLQADLPLATGNYFIGSGPSSSGIVNQTAGNVSSTTTTNLFFGSFGTTTSPAIGTYNQSGGTLGSIAASWNVSQGVNSFSLNTYNLSSGTLNLQAGSLQLGRIGRADVIDTTNTFNQTGGTANVGTLYVGGNTDVTVANVGTTVGNVDGILNLTGGTFIATAFSSMALGSGNDGTINIGGTADVTLPAFPTARGTGSTATITFNGGTLKPAAASTTYMGGLTNAFIKAGGAKFDTTNGSITITQSLLTDVSSLGGGLTKVGSNTLTLTSSNTYTGPTTVTGGTLQLNGAAAASLSTSGLVVNGGRVSFTAGAASTLDLSGKPVSLGGTLAIDIGATGINDALTVGAFSLTANSNLEFTSIGAITNGGSYTIVTSATAIAANGFTLAGQTVGKLTLTPTINTNTITVTPVLAEGIWSISTGGVWSNGNPISTAGNWTNYKPTIAGDAALFGSAISAPATVTVDSAHSVGYLRFDNANSYTIGTSGSSNLTLDNGASAATVTVNSGTHTIAENVTLTSNAVVVPAAGTTLTISGGLSGGGGLQVIDAGTVALTGTNSYTGATTINAGTVALSGSGKLGNGSALTLAGGKLDLGATSQTVGAVLITAPAASGNTIGNGSLTGTSYAASNTTGDAIVSANLLVNGTAGFTKSGAGTVTLSGNNTYTGITAVSAGTLKLSGTGTPGAAGSAVAVSNGALLDLNGTNQSIAFTLGTGTGTVANNLGSGTSILTLSAAPAVSSILIQDNTNSSSGKVAVVVTANTQTLSNLNTYSGGTTVNAGAYVYLQAAAPLGAGTGPITLTASGINTAASSGLLVEGTTYANDISGAGYIHNNVNGAATVTFTGVLNTSGTFNFRNAGNVYNFAGSGNSTLSGNIGPAGAALVFGPNATVSTGSVIKSGTGTLTLAGTNSYTGNTTINGGTLAVTGSLASNGPARILMATPDSNPLGNPIITRRVPITSSYTLGSTTGLGSTAVSVDPDVLNTSMNTTAAILNGTASGQADVSMSWRARTAGEAAGSNPNAVLSNVLNLTGIFDTGTTGDGILDQFVLQMSYTNAALSALGLNETAIALSGELRLGWNDNGVWKTAALGNNAGTGSATFVGAVPYDPMTHTTLGMYGVDPSDPNGGVVWAVLNHNSEFAVIPEPSTLVLGGLALLGFGAAGLRRRRLNLQ